MNWWCLSCRDAASISSNVFSALAKHIDAHNGLMGHGPMWTYFFNQLGLLRKRTDWIDCIICTYMYLSYLSWSPKQTRIDTVKKPATSNRRLGNAWHLQIQSQAFSAPKEANVLHHMGNALLIWILALKASDSPGLIWMAPSHPPVAQSSSMLPTCSSMCAWSTTGIREIHDACYTC